MGDAGARVLTHILQINRHLNTIYFDRNSLSLNNFEDIVNAMEEYVFILFYSIGNHRKRTTALLLKMTIS
jgi:hypothetical protein